MWVRVPLLYRGVALVTEQPRGLLSNRNRRTHSGVCGVIYGLTSTKKMAKPCITVSKRLSIKMKKTDCLDWDKAS